jgi:diaminopimelate epimerase
MQVPFTKMNSQGNDFVVIDNTGLLYQLDNKKIRSICSRDIVGCDQLLLLNIKDSNNVTCEIFNQDGSSAKQCGNGMRAIMLFLNRKYNFFDSKIFVNLVPYNVSFVNEKEIKVSMGNAVFLENIPNGAPENISISAKDYYYEVSVNSGIRPWSFSYSHLSIGNSHCIVFSKGSFDDKEKISNILNSLYDSSVNISFVLNIEEFVQEHDSSIILRVNERGAGWTKSCGSGATATGAFISRFMLLSENGSKKINELDISQEGGELKIQNIFMTDLDGKYSPELYLSGPSTFEYDGVWND